MTCFKLLVRILGHELNVFGKNQVDALWTIIPFSETKFIREFKKTGLNTKKVKFSTENSHFLDIPVSRDQKFFEKFQVFVVTSVIYQSGSKFITEFKKTGLNPTKVKFNT